MPTFHGLPGSHYWQGPKLDVWCCIITEWLLKYNVVTVWHIVTSCSTVDWRERERSASSRGGCGGHRSVLILPIVIMYHLRSYHKDLDIFLCQYRDSHSTDRLPVTRPASPCPRPICITYPMKKKSSNLPDALDNCPSHLEFILITFLHWETLNFTYF